jgi:large repetitive protein
MAALFLEFTGIYTFQAFDPEGILCPSEIVLGASTNFRSN